MIEIETKRLSNIGIECYCGIGIHPRSIPDNLNPSVYETIEKFIELPEVVALAEIGLEKGLELEKKVLEKQLALAKKNDDFPVIVHTPGKNKREITRKLLELIDNIDVSVGVIDHVSLENIDLALDSKLSIGLTVQRGKLSLEQFVVIIREYEDQIDRFMINGDVGIDLANKFAVPEAIHRLDELSMNGKIIERISYKNAEKLFGL